MSDHANARSVVRKIAITAIVGAGSFPITDMIFSSFPEQFAMAVGFGSVVLLVQFLVDFEKRLHEVEIAQKNSVTEMERPVTEGFAGVNNATRLIAQLTRCAVESIDAISIPEVSSAGNASHSFWESDLGRRYVDLQLEAIRRGVRVRRVFVTERNELADDPSLQRICRIQAACGIEVRLLYPSAIPRVISSSLFDFILFDNILSYESTPAAHVVQGDSPILHTRLVLRHAEIEERIERYKNIWESSISWSRAQVLGRDVSR